MHANSLIGGMVMGDKEKESFHIPSHHSKLCLDITIFFYLFYPFNHSKYKRSDNDNLEGDVSRFGLAIRH